MADGSARQRRRFKRALQRALQHIRQPSEQPTTPLESPQNSTAIHRRHTTLSTESFLTIVFSLVAIVLAFVALTEAFPFWLNLAVYFLALSSGLYAMWRWEVSAGWRLRKKLLISGLGIVVYCFFMSFPIYKQYEHETAIKVRFTNAPQFTWWRRQVIIHDIVSLRDYLLRLDIPVPEELPLFSIENNGECGAHNVPRESRVYLAEMRIGAVTNRMAATCAYLNYVVGSKLEGLLALLSVDKFMLYATLQWDLTLYFDRSFWNVHTPDNPGGWFGVFWKIRTQLGRDFGDKIVAYVFKSITDNPREGISEKSDVYLYRRLKTADSIIDNEAAKWPEINKIIKDSGISIEP